MRTFKKASYTLKTSESMTLQLEKIIENIIAEDNDETLITLTTDKITYDEKELRRTITLINNQVQNNIDVILLLEVEEGKGEVLVRKNNPDLISKAVTIDNTIKFINLMPFDLQVKTSDNKMIVIKSNSITRPTTISKETINIGGLQVHKVNNEKPLGLPETADPDIMYIVSPLMKYKYPDRPDFIAYGEIFKNKDNLATIETLYI